eukprot:5621947-Prymnesium_polylepis.1
MSMREREHGLIGCVASKMWTVGDVKRMVDGGALRRVPRPVFRVSRDGPGAPMSHVGGGRGKMVVSTPAFSSGSARWPLPYLPALIYEISQL